MDTKNPHKTQSDRSIKPSWDEKELEIQLKKALDGDVFFDNAYKAMYSRDASNYRFVPIGVVRPRNKEDIIQTVKICRSFSAPILSRGGGTSLAGQTTNTAVIIDMSRYYHKIIGFDKEAKTIRVQPGIILDAMRGEAEKYGLTFGPDPATHTHNTIGGMLGNNSCGIHSVMAVKYGKGARTSDNTKKLEILTYDGEILEVGKTSDQQIQKNILAGGRKAEIYKALTELRDQYATLIDQKFPKIPRIVSGYNLPELMPENGFNVARALVGSEGTCVTILEAEMELIPNPKCRVVMVIGFKDVYEVGYCVPLVLEQGPIALEGIDDKLISYMHRTHLREDDLKLLPSGSSCMITEWDGDTLAEAHDKAVKMINILKQKNVITGYEIYDKPSDQEKIWLVREAGLGATAYVPREPDTWPGWEDSSVPPEKVGDYLKDLRKLLDKYHYDASLYGHFGQGCIHCRLPFELRTAEGLAKYRDFVGEASALAVSYGGSNSGEHGDGQARGELLEQMFGPELMDAFRKFKSIWDPEWKMNPGKVIDAYPITSDLRLGTSYEPAIVKTKFVYPKDKYDFSRSTMRCVGVGECRRFNTGTMCPSYMVTGEEKYSTRGRASLLFEMLQEDVIKDGWQSEEVKESLDMCLACKGCKGDCPVAVDMATYKSEFLSHYYEKHRRPRHAYAMGFINKWARLASISPNAVNFVSHTGFMADLTKSIPGLAKQREVPAFAPETFRDWFLNRENPNPEGKKVILWPDTFNNYFFPDTAKAAVFVLESAGFQVVIPKKHLCCGRPLYDYGFIDKARQYLQDILGSLQQEIREGIPVVGLEPSCVSVFRDEMKELLPRDKDAYRLYKQTYLFSEFLMKEKDAFHFPQIKKTALVHGHCHHKSIMRMDKENELLAALGLECEFPDDGCCGLAGSFGFEQEHYEISMQIGERKLLPAVRKTKSETLIITNGFSCREQIRHGTGKKALHIAEVIYQAMQPTTI